MNKEAKILIGVGLVIILGGWALAKFGPKTEKFVPPADLGKLVRDDSHGTHGARAKVTLVEFGDYQCPACAAAHPVLKQIVEAYKDNPDFTFVFRNFPLTEIHNAAEISSEAAEAAAEQGKFWEMHDLLYEKQSEWAGSQAEGFLIGYAESLGLDVTKFRQALDQQKFANVIKTDRADGEALKINSTPSFFLNDEKMVGVPVFETLKLKIDEKLK